VQHRRRAPRFIREAFAECLVGVRAEDLYRDVSVEPFVAGLPHLARATFVDARREAVPTREEPTLVRVVALRGGILRWHIGNGGKAQASAIRAASATSYT